jgi:hypothetical protein
MTSTLETCANTAARPASPAVGDTLYQTDTKQVITCSSLGPVVWQTYNSDNSVGYDLDGTNITTVAPLFHFDAEKINGTDASGNPSNAAAFTGQWTSRVNGRTTAAQGTAGAQPTYYTSGENSKPYIYFDGGDYLFLTDNVYLQGDFTICIIGKRYGSYTNFTPLGPWGSDVSPSAATFDLGAGGIFSGRHGDYLMFYSSASAGYPGSSSFPTGKDYELETRNLIFKRASSSASLYFDGDNLGTSNPTTGTSDCDVRIGTIGRGTTFTMTGYIYEIIGFESALSTTDLNAWNAYVTTRYNCGTGAMESQDNF